MTKLSLPEDVRADIMRILKRGGAVEIKREKNHILVVEISRKVIHREEIEEGFTRKG